MNPFSITTRLLRLLFVLILVGFLFFTYISQTDKSASFHLLKQTTFDAERSIYPGRYLHPLEHEKYEDNSWHPSNTKPSQTTDHNAKKEGSKPNNAVSVHELTHIKRIKGKKPLRTFEAEPMPLTELIYEPGHRDKGLDEERICKNKGVDVKLLILITSRVGNTNARSAIRRTWMYYAFRQDIGIAFVLGRSNSKYDITNLDRENLMHADIIRGNSIDSYRNLTLKTISLLEWAHRRCPYAKYVLKTDDDVFINVGQLLSFIDKNEANRTIFGQRIDGARPVRNYASKYYVSTRHYPASTFPSFTSGPAYLLTGDIVHELYKQSLRMTYLHLEDVYITGIVAEMLGIERVHGKQFANLRAKFQTCLVRKRISFHDIAPYEQFKLWQKLFDKSIECIRVPTLS